MVDLKLCPMCEGANIRAKLTFRDTIASHHWQLMLCDDCSGAFVNPQPSWEELAPYYPDDYTAYEENHGAKSCDDLVVSAVLNSGSFEEVPVVKGSTILDLGCGSGYFLRIAQKVGARAIGIEPSERGFTVCRQAGLNVFHGTLETYAVANPSDRFDVISASHVLGSV